jgi:hypothetical protein
VKPLPILIFILVLAAAATRAQQTAAPAPPAADSRAPVLRARVLDLAGAMGNDGFKLRDGTWCGQSSSGKPAHLAVHLFAGNQYWFCAAFSEDAREPAVVLRDTQGNPVAGQPYSASGLAAAGVTVAVTGRYVVSVESAGGKPAEFCLAYLFK